MVKKVAILTNGGDAPGLNAVIRAIVKTAETNGVECYGFIEGYKGLLNNNCFWIITQRWYCNRNFKQHKCIQL